MHQAQYIAAEKRRTESIQRQMCSSMHDGFVIALQRYLWHGYIKVTETPNKEFDTLANKLLVEKPWSKSPLYIRLIGPCYHMGAVNLDKLYCIGHLFAKVCIF